MSTPIEGGRGLRFGVFGIPVHLDLSFVLIMGLLGWASGVRRPVDLVVWLVVATFSVLVHEFGHAVVARTTGARPAVALTGFGGVTTYVPPRPLTRWRSLATAVAGPFAGLAVGALLWLARSAVGADLEPGSIPERALAFGIFMTIAWSVLNLMPILPLDGGQAMRELLPGDPEVRARRAAMVSLVVMVPLFGLALWMNQMFVAVFLVLFGFSNLQALMARPATGRPAASGRPATDGRPATAGGPGVAPEQAVVGLLWQGAVTQARRTLESLPPGTPVDLAVHGAVLAVTDQPEQGLALLHQELARRPGDGNVAALLVLTHALRHDWDAVVADLGGSWAGSIPAGVVERAIAEASAVGREDVAARLSALPRPGSS